MGERRKGAAVANVAKGDADIAEEAAAFGAEDGRAGEFLLESGFVQGEEFEQIGRGEVGAKALFHEARGLGEAVPRADGEAIVTTVDAAAEGGAKFDGNRAFQFDCQV